MLRVISALLALGLCLAVVPAAEAQNHGWHGGPNRDFYDRGYRDGYKHGERDARRGAGYDFDHAPAFRRGNPEFRRGYADGYRAGYEHFRGLARQVGPRVIAPGRIGRGAYQDPAYARGYADGYERGLDDGRDRDRYDPVRHRDYRNADDGYDRRYGSRDAYKNNYRAGFRQGYEQGYRDGTRYRW